jgi:hypothetical protein
MVELRAEQSLSELARGLKGRIARDVNRHLGRSGALWQPGFHDHAIRCDEDLIAVARYVVGNPLRAGLVDVVGDYPFWDAVWLNAGVVIAAEAAPTRAELPMKAAPWNTDRG